MFCIRFDESAWKTIILKLKAYKRNTLSLTLKNSNFSSSFNKQCSVSQPCEANAKHMISGKSYKNVTLKKLKDWSAQPAEKNNV